MRITHLGKKRNKGSFAVPVMLSEENSPAFMESGSWQLETNIHLLIVQRSVVTQV